MTAIMEAPTTDDQTATAIATDQPIVPDGETTTEGDASPVVPVAGEETTKTAPEPIRVAAANMAPDTISLLGYELSWNVRGTLVSRETLGTLLKDRGLYDFFPNKPPAPILALRRAIAEWANKRDTTGELFAADDGEEITRSRKLIREVRTKAEGAKAATIVLALVEEKGIGESLSLKYGLSYRFKLTPPDDDGTTWKLAVSTESRGKIDESEREAREEERREVDRAIRVAWEKHRDLYNGADISKLLIECVQAARGISVESGTGVWFVPFANADMVDRLENFVADLRKIGTAMPHLRVRENIDWPRTKTALRDAAEEALMAEVREAESAIRETEKRNAAKPGSVKVTTLRGFVSELTRVRAKATFFQETLGVRGERITDELTKLGTRAVTMAKANKETREARDTPTVAIAPSPAPEPVREARETREA